jgi:thiamine-monophosphate kinase
MSVQALGVVPAGQALRRAGAMPGDLLYVSGTPGDAAAGLKVLQSPGTTIAGGQASYLLQRFLFPDPRVELGLSLRGVASACIDLSDGLAADAGRLAVASGCGVRIDAALIPLSEALASHAPQQALASALCGGDDYELCFTVSPRRCAEFEARMTNVKCRVTRIGVITAGNGVQIVRDGMPVDIDTRGYDHFAHQ